MKRAKKYYIASVLFLIVGIGLLTTGSTLAGVINGIEASLIIGGAGLMFGGGVWLGGADEIKRQVKSVRGIFQ